MKPVSGHEIPDHLQPTLKRAKVLEWVTIAYLLTVVVLMYFVMGSSQAMKTAWAEDLLSLVPPIVFLISNPIRHKEPNERFPFGYHRVATVSFLFASAALLTMGVLLLSDSIVKLVTREHSTINSVSWFGEPIWLGWLMIAVLAYSVVGPVILGYLKHTPARELHDKTLFADAQMNKADWMTGVAGIAGILGIGMGWWWADATAAIVISGDIAWDGLRNVKACLGDIMDRAPAKVDHSGPHPLPDDLRDALRSLPWVKDADVRLREAGHVFIGQAFVVPVDERDPIARAEEVTRLAEGMDWRMHELAVQFVDEL